jgi:tRNA G18 (ribose-2'-O)-methylase SpoU
MRHEVDPLIVESTIATGRGRLLATFALVLGSVGDGISRHALGAAETVLTIPMLHGVDALNIARASAVALWALRDR